MINCSSLGSGGSTTSSWGMNPYQRTKYLTIRLYQHVVRCYWHRILVRRQHTILQYAVCPLHRHCSFVFRRVCLALSIHGVVVISHIALVQLSRCIFGFGIRHLRSFTYLAIIRLFLNESSSGGIIWLYYSLLRHSVAATSSFFGTTNVNIPSSVKQRCCIANFPVLLLVVASLRQFHSVIRSMWYSRH